MRSSVYSLKSLTLPALIATSLFAGIPANAQNDVLTWHNDAARTGQNLNESILTPAQVNSTNFGLLANIQVDGKVDAQPLYVSALTLPGLGTHNVLFVATEHDSLYAVDADTGKIYWKKSMLGTNETTSDSRGCGQVVPEIGITATPAISRQTGPHGTIYLVAMSKNGSGDYFQRIHALDLATGAEQFGGPMAVQATFPGTGDGSSNGTVTFDPKQYKERPALLLANGLLYTSWGSHCDIRPYAGWMMAYNPTTLQQTNVIDFVPNGSDAAPWNAGAGPAADAAGNIYISLGNGTFDTTLTAQGLPAQADYGNSLLKMNSRLAVLDYWTMYNSDAESNADTDLGSGGYMLLPDLADATGKIRHLSVAAGKDNNLYLADRDNMGHYDATDDGTIYQQLTGGLPGGMFSSPAYFNNRIYYGPVGSNLRSFSFASAKLGVTPPQSTAITFGYPGTTPSVSAYNAVNGIVWATENTSPAVLHAYDATNLATELYNSNQAAAARDQFGIGNKFIAPTIANGKVYVGTTNSVAIFGFVHQAAPPLADGDYVLTNQYSKLVLDDPAVSTASGVAMYQWPANGGLNQRWFVSFNGRGFYTIQNVASKLFLTSPASPSPGVSLDQATPENEDTQLWSLTPSSTGYVIRNKTSGLVFDDLGWTKQQGQHIGLWTPDGGLNQTWSLQ